MSLAPLYRLENQFQAKNGRNLTAGYLLVFLAGTDDPAETFSDYVGTRNPERIVLDDNGRAVVICDDSVAYRLEVYDPEGMLQWTEEPVYCTGSGGGSGDSVEVESTDGSVSVTETTAGGVRYFDLSVAGIPDEPLDWIRAEASVVSDGSVYPAKVDGTMSSTPQGIPVVAGRFYHVTVPVRVVPAGTGTAYDTLSVALEDGNGAICSRDFDIDSSLTDAVELEFSYDYEAPSDGFVFLSVGGTSPFVSVDVVLMAHRVFNGYSSEYAKKAWVGNYFVQNSSLNVESGTITGISGTPIGGIPSATVSAIASSYAESAASSKLDTTAFTNYTASALTGIQQDTAAISSSVSSLETSKVDQSAFDACCSAVEAQVSALSSDVSAIRQDTGAISAAVSGLTGTYIQYADLESASGKITGISGTALWGGHEYSGVWPIVVDNTAEKISAANKTLAVDETMTGYESAGSAVIGVNTSVVLTGLSDYQPISGMTAYQLSGDYAYNSAVSSKAEQSSLTAYQPISGMTAYQLSGDYAYNSSLNDYQPVSGMTAYQPSGNYLVPDDISGKADTSALADYQPTSAMTAYQLSGDYYSASNPSGFITGVDLSDYATTAYVDSSVSSKADSSSLSAYALSSDVSAWSSQINDLSAIVSGIGEPYDLMSGPGIALSSDSAAKETTIWVSADYAENSAVSSKADQSSLTAYQEITGMSAYQLTADMTGYQPSGDYAYNSSLADYQPVSGMTAYQPSGNYLVPDDISGKADVSSLTAYQEITGMSAYQLSGDYAYNSSVSSKMDASASSEFYPMTGNPSSFLVADDITGKADASALSDYQPVSGMTAYQLSGDYAYNSAVSSKAEESALTAYQEISGMTAYQPAGDYQPSGDYIYESALGWAEV